MKTLLLKYLNKLKTFKFLDTIKILETLKALIRDSKHRQPFLLSYPRLLTSITLLCKFTLIFVILYFGPYLILDYFNAFYICTRANLVDTSLEYTTQVKYLTAYDRESARVLLQKFQLSNHPSIDVNVVLNRIFLDYPVASREDILKEIILYEKTIYKPYDFIETSHKLTRIWKDDVKSPALYYFYATYGACSRIFFSLVYLVLMGTTNLEHLTAMYKPVWGECALPVAFLVKYLRENNHFIDAWFYIQIREWYRKHFNFLDYEIMEHKVGVDVVYPTPEVLAAELVNLNVEWDFIVEAMRLEYIENLCELASLF